MSLVLCPTRGGKESIIAQDKAIALAKEQGVPLVFLYIADSSFLNKTAAAVIVDVEEELTEMGEFFLLMAVERADQEGVKATSEIRSGVFREMLPQVALELEASTIVLGRPAGEASHFQEAEFEAYLETLAQETGAVVLTPEKEVGE